MNAGEVAIPNRLYASPHLVHRGRLDRRRHSKVSNARAYDPFLDHRARHHWRHPGRGRNSHIRAANKPTLSPRRHYSLDARCNSYPIRLHQTADPFPARWIASSQNSAGKTQLRCSGGCLISLPAASVERFRSVSCSARVCVAPGVASILDKRLTMRVSIHCIVGQAPRCATLAARSRK